MIRQVDIITENESIRGVNSDLSVKIHGYIMSKLDHEYGAYLHTQQVRPFSIYTIPSKDGFITRISTLTEDAAVISDLFNDFYEIPIYGSPNPLKIVGIDRAPVLTVQQLVSYMTSDRYELRFLTPAMYKSGGKIHFTPDLVKYFDAVSQKLALFEGIEIPHDEMVAAFEQVEILEYDIRTKAFANWQQKRNQRGMTGRIVIQLPVNDSANIIKLLLGYATYSGVGGQTAQGMGGIVVSKFSK